VTTIPYGIALITSTAVVLYVRLTSTPIALAEKKYFIHNPYGTFKPVGKYGKALTCQPRRMKHFFLNSFNTVLMFS
jgi:hypothetical protein